MLRIWNWACNRIMKFLPSICMHIFHRIQRSTVSLQKPSHITTPPPEDTIIDIDTPVHLPRLLNDATYTSTLMNIIIIIRYSLK